MELADFGEIPAELTPFVVKAVADPVDAGDAIAAIENYFHGGGERTANLLRVLAFCEYLFTIEVMIDETLERCDRAISLLDEASELDAEKPAWEDQFREQLASTIEIEETEIAELLEYRKEDPSSLSLEILAELAYALERLTEETSEEEARLWLEAYSRPDDETRFDIDPEMVNEMMGEGFAIEMDEEEWPSANLTDEQRREAERHDYFCRAAICLADAGLFDEADPMLDEIIKTPDTHPGWDPYMLSHALARKIALATAQPNEAAFRYWWEEAMRADLYDKDIDEKLEFPVYLHGQCEMLEAAIGFEHREACEYLLGLIEQHPPQVVGPEVRQQVEAGQKFLGAATS